MEIRVAIFEDKDAWAEMFYELHKNATAESNAFTKEQALATAENYCTVKSSKEECVLTAFLDEVAVGWIQAQKDDPRIDGRGWYIRGVEVRPSFRRQGAARELVNAVVSLAGQEGRDVYCAVRKENNPSIELFVKCGFELVDDAGSFSDEVLVFCKEGIRD